MLFSKIFSWLFVTSLINKKDGHQYWLASKMVSEQVKLHHGEQELEFFYIFKLAILVCVGASCTPYDAVCTCCFLSFFVLFLIK